MTDKELQLVDLCARLPYKTYYDASSWTDNTPRIVVQVCPYDSEELRLTELAGYVRIEHCKPYLRPMSSMTEKERKEYEKFSHFSIGLAPILMDWIYSHHLDCCGLIEKGLALEAPDDMYETK